MQVRSYFEPRVNKQPTDVTAHDTAGRTPLEFHCTPRSTLFQSSLMKVFQLLRLHNEMISVCEWVWTCKDEILSYFKAPSQFWLEYANEYYKNTLSEYTVIWSGFELGTDGYKPLNLRLRLSKYRRCI